MLSHLDACENVHFEDFIELYIYWFIDIISKVYFECEPILHLAEISVTVWLFLPRYSKIMLMYQLFKILIFCSDVQ